MKSRFICPLRGRQHDTTERPRPGRALTDPARVPDCFAHSGTGGTRRYPSHALSTATVACFPCGGTGWTGARR